MPEWKLVESCSSYSPVFVCMNIIQESHLHSNEHIRATTRYNCKMPTRDNHVDSELESRISFLKQGEH